MTTGERIRNVRLSKEMTQRQLGELAGIAEPTIRRYELGKLNPKFKTIAKIASALDVHWLDLLGDDDVAQTVLGQSVNGTSYIGEQIKKCRERKFISPDELGTLIGVSASIIVQYETGLREIDTDTLERIADALDVPIETLYGLSNDGIVDKYETRHLDPKKARGLLDFATIENLLNSEDLAALQDTGLDSLPKVEAAIKNGWWLRILAALGKLNDTGHYVAADRIEELTQIPKYQRCTDTSQSSETTGADTPTENSNSTAKERNNQED